MKKSMKRIVSIALILCLTLSLIPATLAVTYSGEYSRTLTATSGDSVKFYLDKGRFGAQLVIYSSGGLSGTGLTANTAKESSTDWEAYLSGTAGTPGTYNATVVVYNTYNTGFYYKYNITIVINPKTETRTFSGASFTAQAGTSVKTEATGGKVTSFSSDATVTSKSGIPAGMNLTFANDGGYKLYFTGTPTTAGTYNYQYSVSWDVSGTKWVYNYSGTITVTAPAAKPVVTLSAGAPDSGGNFTLTGSVSNVSGSYSYAYYRNTVNSTSGGVQFTPGSTSGSSFSVATGFKGLTEQKYYYYATITYNGKTYTSNVIQRENPNYVAPTPSVTLSVNGTSGNNFQLRGTVSNFTYTDGYNYNIYRNTTNSTSGGTLSYSAQTNSSTFDLWEGFNNLTAQYYYYYATITYGGKTYTSNVIQRANPYYSATASYDYGTRTYTVGDEVKLYLDQKTYDDGYYQLINYTGAGDSGLKVFQSDKNGTVTMSVEGTAAKVGTYDIAVSVKDTFQGKTETHNVKIIIKAPAEIADVTITDIDTPATGNLPDTSASVPSGANYTVSGVQWYVDAPGTGFVAMSASEKFAAGNTYYCEVTLAPKTGYEFKHGIISIKGTAEYAGTALIQGTAPKSTPIVDTTKGTMVVDSRETTIGALAVTLTAGTDNKLTAAVANSKNYTYTLYMNTANTVTGAAAVAEYTNKSNTATAFTVQPSFANLKAEYYYFYVAVTSDGKTVNSNIVQVKNPNYVKPDTFKNPFVDVHETDWFYNDVMTAVKMGLVNGMDATHYKPNDNLTIAQAIKLAACMNQYYYDKKVTLTNATSGVWYNSYVNYAITKGIITFDQFEGKYNNTATRADYVTIFAKALPESEFKAINNIADNKVPDVKSNAVYGPAVYKLYRAGILTGSGSAATYGYFLPNDPIRRSEVAAILTRMMDASTRKTVVLP